MKPTQIDILAFTVLRDLEQINEAQESGLARQCRRDIRKTDGLNRIHFDLAFLHTVPITHCDVETHPYSDTARDFSSTDSIAKSRSRLVNVMNEVYTRRSPGAGAIATRRIVGCASPQA